MTSLHHLNTSRGDSIPPRGDLPPPFLTPPNERGGEEVPRLDGSKFESPSSCFVTIHHIFLHKNQDTPASSTYPRSINERKRKKSQAITTSLRLSLEASYCTGTDTTVVLAIKSSPGSSEPTVVFRLSRCRNSLTC